MTARRKLLWQLFPSYLIILLASLFAVTLYSLSSFKPLYFEQISETLRGKIRPYENRILKAIKYGDEAALARICEEAGKALIVRMSVVLPDGRVRGVVRGDLDGGSRPEIAQSFRGLASESVRYDKNLGKDVLYVALPLSEGNSIVGVIHAAHPLAGFDKLYGDLVKRTVVVGIAIALFAALLSLFVSRRISNPLAELKLGAQRFARGELERPVVVATGTEEIGSLAETMNRMARELSERMQTVTAQSTLQEAILSSMVEGVLAISADGSLMSINEAALKLLRIYQRDWRGKDLQEIVRNSELTRFVEEAVAGESSLEGELVIHAGGERQIQAHGTVLKNTAGEHVGAVVVLHDLTKLRHLESLRKDFVANVSHELKTPLTSIKGFVEMLLDGDLTEPATIRHFLGIIFRQTDRLNEIIEDLLTLSKIERDSEQSRIDFETVPLKDVLASAIDLCASKWSTRKPAITLDCPEELALRLNSRLFEQAIVNLIDNAIKYSDEGLPVTVAAFTKSREAVIQVIDKGPGIEEDHLPRLFERFYRVDKARSREIGGSGLGLAIVKHIVQAHGGFITVRSELGRGSEFSIHIPLAYQENTPL